MSPLGIEILLHYHCRMNDYRDGQWRDAPAVVDLLDAFLSEGMLDFAPEQDKIKYRIGARGRVYIEALLLTPYPVQQWVMP